MSEPTTFNETDWGDLTPADKNALRKFSRVAIGFEPLAKASGVGQKGMDSLIAKGLAVEGEPGLHGRTFQITDKGWLALEWMRGNRMRVPPD